MTNFRFQSQFSIRKAYGTGNNYTDPRSLRNSTPLTDENLISGELYTSDSEGFSYNWTSTLSFSKGINGHNINLNVGWELSDDTNMSSSASYKGFPVGSLSSPSYAQEQVGRTNYSDGITRRVGTLATLNYTYNDIYLFDASFRVDGSSQFGANKRFAPFWSLGAGINIHKYEFFEDLDIFNRLKLRGSYGETGNVKFSPYESYLTYTVQSDAWYMTGFGAQLHSYGNENLTWETTKTTDIGFELAMLDDMIYVKGSYYNKLTVGLISDVTIRPSTGFTSYKDNIGEVLNKGFELEARVRVLRNRNATLNITANLAHNQNRIEKISDSLKEYNEMVANMYDRFTQDHDAAIPTLQFEEGGSLYSLYGVPSLGINPISGSEIYVRKDGSYSAGWYPEDQVIIGNTEPTAQGSFGFDFTYKNFSVYASFMYTFGGDVYNSTLVSKVESADAYGDNVDLRVLTDRWMKPGDLAMFKAASSNRGNPNVSRATDRFVQVENMIAGTSVEISYEVPQNILRKWGLGRTNFALGTNDLFHLSTIRQERGTSYPFARTFNFTLRTSF